MKISKKRLKQIIQEELGRVMKEYEDEEMSPDDLQGVADEERRSWEADLPELNIEVLKQVMFPKTRDAIKEALKDENRKENIESILEETFRRMFGDKFSSIMRHYQRRDKPLEAILDLIPKRGMQKAFLEEYYGLYLVNTPEYKSAEDEWEKQRREHPSAPVDPPPGPESYYGKGRYTGD